MLLRSRSLGNPAEVLAKSGSLGQKRARERGGHRRGLRTTTTTMIAARAKAKAPLVRICEPGTTPRRPPTRRTRAPRSWCSLSSDAARDGARSCSPGRSSGACRSLARSESRRGRRWHRRRRPQHRPHRPRLLQLARPLPLLALLLPPPLPPPRPRPEGRTSQRLSSSSSSASPTSQGSPPRRPRRSSLRRPAGASRPRGEPSATGHRWVERRAGPRP
jgi:hypothetical protein